MNNVIDKYLFDILDAIDGLDIHLGKRKLFRKYEMNRTIRKAVDREIEIIGEAVRRA
jgi:uncharacterized protein with HEPN domain